MVRHYTPDCFLRKFQKVRDEDVIIGGISHLGRVMPCNIHGVLSASN